MYVHVCFIVWNVISVFGFDGSVCVGVGWRAVD